MNRKEKIQILKDLQSGKKTVKEVFPPFRVSLIEMQKGIWLDLNAWKNVSADEMEQYIEALKQSHPEGVDVDRIDHEEYLVINERLENEY